MSSVVQSKQLLEHLSDAHKIQMEKYLKYFRSKKSEHLNEVKSEFNDSRDKLQDEIFPIADVRIIIDDTCNATCKVVQKELEVLANANAIIMRSLFLQAEARGFDLTIDTDAADIDFTTKPVYAGKLAPIQGAVDINLVTKIKELEEANKNLQVKCDEMDMELAHGKKDKESINASMQNLKLSHASEISAITKEVLYTCLLYSTTIAHGESCPNSTVFTIKKNGCEKER